MSQMMQQHANHALAGVVGNLPRIAESIASAGHVCVRYTCKPVRLSYRVKACQVKSINRARQVASHCLHIQVQTWPAA